MCLHSNREGGGYRCQEVLLLVTSASIVRSKRPLRFVKFLDFFEMKIITNSLEPGEPKDINDCTVFALYEYFASDGQIDDLKKSYKDGIS